MEQVSLSGNKLTKKAIKIKKGEENNVGEN
jgi:hypothetical protein